MSTPIADNTYVMATADQDLPDGADAAGSSPRRKSSIDRLVKVGFLVAVVAGGVVIYFHQLEPAELDWGREPEETLAKARKTNRPVVLFFTAERQNEETRRMIEKSLTHNTVKSELAERKYLTAVIEDDSMKSDLARRYGVTTLPCLVVLSPQGELRHRDSGYLGHATVVDMLDDDAP